MMTAERIGATAGLALKGAFYAGGAIWFWGAIFGAW